MNFHRRSLDFAVIQNGKFPSFFTAKHPTSGFIPFSIKFFLASTIFSQDSWTKLSVIEAISIFSQSIFNIDFHRIYFHEFCKFNGVYVCMCYYSFKYFHEFAIDFNESKIFVFVICNDWLQQCFEKPRQATSRVVSCMFSASIGLQSDWHSQWTADILFTRPLNVIDFRTSPKSCQWFQEITRITMVQIGTLIFHRFTKFAA